MPKQVVDGFPGAEHNAFVVVSPATFAFKLGVKVVL